MNTNRNIQLIEEDNSSELSDNSDNEYADSSNIEEYPTGKSTFPIYKYPKKRRAAGGDPIIEMLSTIPLTSVVKSNDIDTDTEAATEEQLGSSTESSININKVSNLCPKEKPIFADTCQLIFCTQEQYNNKKCQISNGIINTQWLNNIQILGEKNCRYFTIANSFNGDLIFESSYEGNDILSSQRFFYGFNNIGRPLFIDKYKDELVYNKILFLEKNLQKHFSELVFLNLKNDNSNNTQKALSIGKNFEIYDYSDGYNGKISVYDSEKLLGKKIFSDRNSLFELKNQKNNYIFAFNTENEFNIIKFNYNSADVKLGFNQISNNMKNIFGTSMISCYDTNSYIVCFYRNSDKNYELSLYNLQTLGQISGPKIISENTINSYKLFFKTISLKDNVGILIYYLSIDDKCPILEINKFSVNTNTYNITPYLKESNYTIIKEKDYNLNNNYNKNDLTKITDTRFSLITTNLNNQLIIIMFDIYQAKVLLIKYYKIPTLELYNFAIVDNIRGYSILNTLGIGFTCLDKNTNEIFTKFINFGLSNDNDISIDLNFIPICRCLYFQFKNFTTKGITNNLFGYEPIGIKIISIPNDINISFYYNQTTTINMTFVEKGQNVSMDDIIRLEVSGNSYKKNLLYSVIYREIKNPTMLLYNFTDKFEIHGDNNYNFYSPNVYDGKAELIQFTLNLIDFNRNNAIFCGEKNNWEYSISNSGRYTKYLNNYNCSGGCGENRTSSGGTGGTGGEVGPHILTICHDNCFKCYSNGTNNDQNCSICNSGMGIKEDEEKENVLKGYNCYKPPIDFYYFDDSIPFKYRFRKCYETCKTCSGKGTSTNNSCLTCKNSYYEKEEDLNEKKRNCYKYPQQGYVLDDEQKKFIKCDISCINCTNPTDISSTYCIGCNTDLGYYPLEDNIQKCYKNISGYFLDLGTKKWIKCADGCETCSNKANGENMNCLTCISNSINQYYFKENSNNCYREAPFHYFLKEKNGVKKFYECSDNCLSCEYDANYCISCFKNWTFNERQHTCYFRCNKTDEYFDFETKKCSKNCSNKYYYKDPLTKQCVNCKDNNKFLLIGNETKCVDVNGIVEGYFFNDKDKDRDEYKFNVLESCYKSCETCPIKSSSAQNQNCITCKAGYYLVEGTNNCEKVCNPNTTIDKYYIKDETNRKCINCKNNINGKIYKFIDEDECISKSELDSRPYKYRNVDIKKGVIEKCHPNCLQCSGYSNDTNNMKCISCKSNYYLLQDSSNCYNNKNEGLFLNKDKNIFQKCNNNCLDCEEKADKCTKCSEDKELRLIDNRCVIKCEKGKFLLGEECVDFCGNYYFHDDINNKCINCKEMNKYIDLDNLNNGCIDKNENYYENTSDSEFQKFGVIQKCYFKCKTCFGNSTNDKDQKCNNCNTNYYLRYETNNCMEACDDNHDNYYVKDENNKCINCKKESMKLNNNQEYKYINDNTKCLDKETVIQLYGGFFDIDENTGTIDNCHPNCLTCKSKSTNISNMSCLSCDNSKGFYMVENTQNCYNYPPDYYFLDETNNIYTKCYSTCRTCNSKGDENNNKCLQCDNDLYNYKDGEKCLNSCNETDYSQNFIANNNYKVCLDFKCNYNDINTNRNLVQLYYDTTNKECIQSCNGNSFYFDGLPICLQSCDDISKYKDFIKENYSSYSNFYDEYYLPYNKIFYSEVSGICNTYCKINNNSINRITCNQYFDQIIKSSLSSNMNNLLKIIEENKIIEINSYYSLSKIYQFYLFNISEISNNTDFISNNTDISDIILKDCFKNLIINESDIEANQSLILYKIDEILDEYLSNRIYYELLIDNGTILNLRDICKKRENIIYSPINPLLNKEIQLVKEINESQSINLFNPDEKIFNDICEPFFYDNMDININLRIKYFYQNYNLCQENCYYNGIKFNENKVECICPEDYVITEQYNNEKLIKSNRIINNNPNMKKYNNIRILKCNKMFYKFSQNFGFIVFFVFLIFSIFAIVIFYLKEYQPQKIKKEFIKLYELKTQIKEERILIEPVRPVNEEKNKKKEKKSNFKLIIGFFTSDNNNNIPRINKHRIKNEKQIEDDGKTITYEKNMFSDKPLKTESKEKLIDEPKYNIIKKEFSEYRLKAINNNIIINKDNKGILFLKLFLANYPLTNICFHKKEYKLMNPRLWIECLTLNLLFYFGLFSILTIINCILFNDNLITDIFESPSHKLSFIKYFVNSCYASAFYIIIGIIFSLIFIYGIQGFHLGDVYDSKIFKSKIKDKIKTYFIGIIIFQAISVIFIIFAWYYSSIFCNIYNKSQKYIVFQTLLSLAFEIIFYIILSAIIFLYRK